MEVVGKSGEGIKEFCNFSWVSNDFGMERNHLMRIVFAGHLSALYGLLPWTPEHTGFLSSLLAQSLAAQ